MQNWFGLSDPRMEEAVRDHAVPPVRAAAAAMPDDTTILNFRRLLETHKLAERILVLTHRKPAQVLLS